MSDAIDREFSHVSVLKQEIISAISVKPGGLYIDMTVGGGGHSSEILSLGGRVIGIDRDEDALCAAEKRLSQINSNYKLIRSNFSDVADVMQSETDGEADGIIMDLGVSSFQLDEAGRGFSYMQDAPLDMRMDRRANVTAEDIVNSYSTERLADIISKYGEERWAKRIAEFIVNGRKNERIKTTAQLVAIIKAAVPKGARKDGPHPAKRTFQAIRIEVNGELEILKQAVTDGVGVLKKGSRIGIITFHSLEDRIVKSTFAALAAGCTCPAGFPICVCKGVPQIRIITKKPTVPSESEISGNPRARSAKLRVAEKI